MKFIFSLITILFFSFSVNIALAQESATIEKVVEKKIVILEEIENENGEITTKEVTLTGAEADAYINENNIDISNGSIEKEIEITKTIDENGEEKEVKSITEKSQNYKVVQIDDDGNKIEMEWDGTGEMPAEMKALMDEHNIADQLEEIKGDTGESTEVRMMKVITKEGNGTEEEISITLDGNEDLPEDVQKLLKEKGIDIEQIIVADKTKVVGEENVFVVEGDVDDIEWVTEEVDPNTAQLGVHISDVENGAEVIEVVCCSAADMAGIIISDVITKIDKTEINDIESLVDAIGSKKPGDKVKVHLLRNGKTIKKKITLIAAKDVKKCTSESLSCCSKEEMAACCKKMGISCTPEQMEACMKMMKEGCCKAGSAQACCKGKSDKKCCSADEAKACCKKKDNYKTNHKIIVVEDGSAMECNKVDALKKKVVVKSTGLDSGLGSKTKSVEKVIDVDVENALEVNEIKVFPNPSQGIMQVEFDANCAGKVNVHVVDLAGRRIYDEQFDHFDGSFNKEINLKGIKSGTLLLVIAQGDKVFTEKIVLQ